VVHVERRQRSTRHRHHHHHHGDDATTTTDGGGPSGSDQVESDEEYARRLQVCNVFSTYMLWHGSKGFAFCMSVCVHTRVCLCVSMNSEVCMCVYSMCISHVRTAESVCVLVFTCIFMYVLGGTLQ